MKIKLLVNILKFIILFLRKNLDNGVKCCTIAMQTNRKKVGAISASYSNRAFFMPIYSVFLDIKEKRLIYSEWYSTTLIASYGFYWFAAELGKPFFLFTRSPFKRKPNGNKTGLHSANRTSTQHERTKVIPTSYKGRKSSN